MNYNNVRVDDLINASHLPGDAFVASINKWFNYLEAVRRRNRESRLVETIALITGIVSAIFIILSCSPILLIVKTFSAYKQMQNILPAWKKLASAINQPLHNNIENLSWRQKVKVSLQFYPWFIAHSHELSRIENPEIKQIYINIRDSLIKDNCIKRLNLSGMSLTTLPDIISQLTNLRMLDLSDNQLTALPETISQLTHLEELNLRDNQLTELPETISQLTHLENLDLYNNRLTTLPDSLALHPATCWINLNNNRLSAETIATFEERVSQVRAANPRLGPNIQFSIHDDNARSASNSLDKAIQFWISAYQKACPKFSINQKISHYNALLTHPNKDQLRRFLDRLKSIADFKNGGSAKNQVIYQVGQMLDTAAVDASYRDVLFAGLEEALQTCGDRVNMYFNTLEINYRLSKSKGISTEALVELLVGAERIDMLRKIAEKRVEELGKGDAIEVHLYYQVELREPLKLPISMKEMLYKGIGTIPKKILDADRDTVLKATKSPEDVAKILCSREQWVERVKTNAQQQLDEINEVLQIKFDALSKDVPSQEYKQNSDALLAQFQQQTSALIKKLTLQYLSTGTL